MSDKFTAGKAVRLIHDPGKIGTLTNKSRERAGKRLFQVRFPEGCSYQQEYELELVDDSTNDPYELLEQSRFGRLKDLRRNLTHIQLSGRLANLVYSMDVTNTDFYAYQYKPVLSFLESPSNGILIADEVGLGKTIEAGLIWTELRSRYDARRVLVLCPAMLREKWRDELRDRFAVDAEIMGAGDLLTELNRDKHDTADGKGLICSMQGLRPGRRWDDEKNNTPKAKLARFLDEMSDEAPLFDLVIIDEAHYMRNPESQTAKLGQLLRPVTDNIVLLSATPVNLKSDDLFHLINLVDPDSFEYRWQFPEILEANKPLNEAKIAVLDTSKNWFKVKEILERSQHFEQLRDSRQLKALLAFNSEKKDVLSKHERISLSNKIEKINLLRHAVTRTRKSEVHEWQVTRVPHTYFIDLTDHERNFYDAVTHEIRLYAMRKNLSDGFLLATPQRQISSCMYAAAQAWLGRTEQDKTFYYEAFGEGEDNPFGKQEYLDDDSLSLTKSIIKAVSTKIDLEKLKDQDSKYIEFRSIINEYLKQDKDEKLIVFSFFRGTLKYLSQRLREDGFTTQVLMGGMKESKQEVIYRFKNSKDIRILLSSEVASEGVDLQFCKLLINYDLPWNPMKVEQRIGRIDRLGQQSPKIKIWNLCYSDTIDERIHQRLFTRLKIFEQALGGLEAILGEKIAKLTKELFSQELTEEEENTRIERTAMAIERVQQENRNLEKQASNLIAHSGYILESVQAAHDFKQRITKEDLVIYVKDYLSKFAVGHSFHEVDHEQLLFEIQLPGEACSRLSQYCKEQKLHGKTRLAEGSKYQCQFVNKIKRNVGRTEYINQFHPLIRFISFDLRERDEAFYPLISLQIDAARTTGIDSGLYAFVTQRWEFSGIRTEEELVSIMIRVNDKQLFQSNESMGLINEAKTFGKEWLEAKHEVNNNEIKKLFEFCEDELDSNFKDVALERDNENIDRIELQKKAAKKHFNRELQRRKDTLDKYKFTGKKQMIPAFEGRIKKLKERYDIQLKKLESKIKLKRSYSDVCMGLIKVC